VLLLVATPLLFSLHVVMVLLIFAPCLAIAIAMIRTPAQRTRILLFVLWAVIVLLANIWWIRPMLAFMGDKLPTASLLQPRAFLDLAEDIFHVASWYLLVLLVGSAGLYQLWLDGRRRQVAVLIAGGLVLLYLGYGGHLLELTSNLEPKRFKVAAAVLLTIPAGCALVGAVTRIRHGKMRRENLLAIILTLVGPCYTIGLGMFRENKLAALPTYQLTCTLSPEERDLVDYLKTKTEPTDGPIAYEDRLKVRRQEAVNLSPLLPILTGRRFIGGPNPRGVIAYNAVNFYDQQRQTKRDKWASFFLYRYLSKTSTSMLADRLKLMHINVAVIHSAPAIKQFSQIEDYKLETSIGRYRIYRRTTPEPSPRIEATYDRIAITNAPSDPFVIPLHYVKGLRPDDGVTLSREWPLGDKYFSPFIQVKPNGKRAFEIRFDPR